MRSHLFGSLAILLLTGSSLCELLGVIQVHRHGARTGKKYSDITSNLFFGTSDTQLTINGMKQHESLGHWISERYIHYDYQLLSRHYDSEEIIFKSSPIERTIFSAVAFIKGLYPHSRVVPVFKGDENTEWKMKTDDLPPIPGYKLRVEIPSVALEIADPNQDNVFHASSCKFSDSGIKVKDQFVSTKIFDFSDDEIKEAIDNIKSIWDVPFQGKTEQEIYNKKLLKELNAFITPTNYHFSNSYFKLSDKATAVLQKIQVEKWYGGRVADSKALKVEVSGFFKEFLHYFNQFTKRCDDKSRKLRYVVYSGHDGSIITLIANLFSQEKLMNMLKDLNPSYSFLQPGFASHFNFELHTAEGSKFLGSDHTFVRIIYNGQVMRDGFKAELPYDRHNDGIDFDVFQRFMFSRIDESYETLYCKKSGDDELSKLKSNLPKFEQI